MEGLEILRIVVEVALAGGLLYLKSKLNISASDYEMLFEDYENKERELAKVTKDSERKDLVWKRELEAAQVTIENLKSNTKGEVSPDSELVAKEIKPKAKRNTKK